MHMHLPDYWLDCDYISGACLSFENGRKHLHISNISSEHGLYGFAVSHTILGIEELIKSLVLVCINRDISFMEEGERDKIFKNHNYKHKNIRDFFLALTNERIEHYKLNWIEYFISPWRTDNKFVATCVFLSEALGVEALDVEEANNLCDLLQHANVLKNKGFYVDFVRSWESPEDVSKEKYLVYRSLASKLYSFINPIFTLPLTNESVKSFLYGDYF